MAASTNRILRQRVAKHGIDKAAGKIPAEQELGVLALLFDYFGLL
jgi:hypothetical protein